MLHNVVILRFIHHNGKHATKQYVCYVHDVLRTNICLSLYRLTTLLRVLLPHLMPALVLQTLTPVQAQCCLILPHTSFPAHHQHLSLFSPLFSMV